jgi:2-polyprenyl-3-methyl-5-hydroxy-6-metoxy-1,4-benzoquinol methylase
MFEQKTKIEITGSSQEDIYCPFCKQTEIYTKFKLTDHNILRCSSCDFMWLYPQPTLGQLKEVYDISYFKNAEFFEGNDATLYGYHDYLAERFTKQEEYSPIILKAKKLLRNGEDVNPLFLDVGCGLGFFMDVAQDEGCQVSGIEFNASAVERIRSKYIFPVFLGDILEFPDDQVYDIAAMMDVIEHFQHPIEAIKKIHQILKPGGILVLSTMDCDSIVSRLLGKRLEDFRRVNEHLYFFTKKTISTLLEQEGFKVMDVKYNGHTFRLDFLANRLKNVSLTGGRFITFLVNLFGLSKSRINLNPRTKILIFARKK